MKIQCSICNNFEKSYDNFITLYKDANSETRICFKCIDLISFRKSDSIGGAPG